MGSNKSKKASQKSISKPVTRWQKWLRASGNFILQSSVPELLLISYLCFGRAVVNPDFSYPSEIILNIVLLGILATLWHLLYRKALLRRFGLGATHLASLLTAYQLYAFSYAYGSLTSFLSKLLPHLTYFGWTISILILSTILFGAVSAVVGWTLRRFLPQVELALLKIAVFTIGFVFATQLVKVIGLTWDFRQALAYKQPAVTLKQDASKITAKPNVYYLVFDRYASADTLKQVYGYDNTKTLDLLANQGFYNHTSALSNYPFTMQSIGSTLRMGYHADLDEQFPYQKETMQAGFPYRTFLDNPPVVQELKKNGYRYNVVSSWWDFTRKSPSADYEPTNSYRLRILGKTFWASDLQRDIINKSVLSPLLLKGITIGNKALVKYDLDRNPQTNFRDQMTALKNIARDAHVATQPQFTFAHILSPHDPYVFMPDGSNTRYDGNRTDKGEDEFTKYTNQLAYVNTQLQSLVQTIRSKDPNAVLILQTDEGPYPKEFRGNQTASKYHTPLTLSTTGMTRKFGSFASYYFPGVSQEESAQEITSHVNVFRFLLRHYLGYDTPSLPDCHFAVGAKFNLYGFTDVTRKVDPTNTADCKPYL